MSESSIKDLKLYRGWDDKGQHVWSPFVVKLEARLRFAGVPYATDTGSPRTAPNGKIPYVEYQERDSSSPTALGDSGVIARTLVEQGFLPDINAELSPEARAQDLATRALLEDKLYFYHTKERWIDHYYTMRDHALWSIPYPIRVLVGQLAYRGAVKTLHGQGTGRLSDDEIRLFRHEIWQTISDFLVSVQSKRRESAGEAEKAPFWFLGGDRPTEVDTTLFGFIVSVLVSTAGPESQQVVKSFPALLDYAERIHDSYFPDYQKW